MRTPRDRSESQQVDVYPPTQACPACQQPLKARDHKPRWISQLDQHVKVVRHCLAWWHTAGERRAAVYRPHQEDTRAVRGDPCGLDVVARMGARRYRENWSITKMRGQLQDDSNRAISINEVALRCAVFLAFVTTGARQDHARIEPWRLWGGMVLAIAGVQPAQGHEARYMVRDVRAGRVFVAKTRRSSATSASEPLIDEVLG